MQSFFVFEIECTVGGWEFVFLMKQIQRQVVPLKSSKVYHSTNIEFVGVTA